MATAPGSDTSPHEHGSGRAADEGMGNLHHTGMPGMEHNDMTGMHHSGEPGMNHAGMDHAGMAGMDHSGMAGMDHSGMAGMDHSGMAGMDHSGMAGMDHAGMAGMDHSGMAGMDHAGMAGMDHSAHVARFRRLFWIMLIIAVPVVLCSRMFADIVGYALPSAGWIDWIAPVLGTVMYAIGGAPFLRGAISELRQRKPAMMTLIAMAITVAYLASLGASTHLLDHTLDFWWELALLIVIMLLGHWIEMRSLAQTSSALDALAALIPDTAELADGDGTRTVPVAALSPGQVVVVRPGARVPADGTVLSGSANMNEAAITGESAAVLRGPGDSVVAGTVSTDSALRITVTAVGADTALAGIRRLVAQAQASGSRAQRIADRAAGALFWFALGAAVITAVVWTLVGSPADAVTRSITVLVIACPHALGLAIPLVVAIATERAARAGILVKDRLALERMRSVDVVLFDKTGTLTTGTPRVTAILAAPQHAEADVLALAAAAEADSEHPLARAITAAAEHGERKAATDFESSPALGVSATVDGTHVEVGGPRLLRERGRAPLPATAAWSDDGATILHVLIDGTVVGALELTDEVRPEATDTVAALHGLGVAVAMVTGDSSGAAHAAARTVGIDRVFAEVRPEDKEAQVRTLQAEGSEVSMVGDGVNDAPALARADVGIAIGAGTDVAIAAAGIVLTGSDPRGVVSAIRLSRAAYRKMQQNLAWAAGYNLLSVPLAAGVLAPIGFVLPMSVGAVLMSLSTIVVAINAQLLRRLDLSPAAAVAAVIGDHAVTGTSRSDDVDAPDAA